MKNLLKRGMTKTPSFSQRNIIISTTLMVFFALFRSCQARNSFDNLDFSTQTLNPVVTGFMVSGNAVGDSLGNRVGAAGDINNDGYDDIIIGALNKNGNQGAAYVIYGGEESSFMNIDLSTTTLIPSTTGFKITGNAAGDYLGISVSTAGDIDNDGYDDIIVGAAYKNGQQGAAYVIYGGAKSTMSNIDLSSITLNPSTTGFKITGSAAGDFCGVSANKAGDINKDGYDDIIIGAHGKNGYQGAAYVIYGRDKSFMSNWDFSSGATLTPSTTGFMITGNAAGDSFGYSARPAGDINNDGYDDIIVGAYGKNSFQGAAYVIYGRASMSNIDLSSTTLAPLTTGFMITGNAVGDFFGNSVSTAGDINHDGYDDIIIGAYQKNSNQGAAYVIYGGDKSTRTNFDLSTQILNPLKTGFMITGNAAGDQLGLSLNTAGDVNKDGYDDIIVSARGKNSYQGAVYVIYGGTKATRTNIDFSSGAILAPSTTGFTITGNAAGNYFGNWVSTAGDINKDGYDDIIIGASGKNAAYVIYASCSKNCKQCISESVCTVCQNSYFLYQYECFNSCPTATFTSTDTCQDCPSYCSSCTSQGSCTSCYQGYTLSKSLCVLSFTGAQEQATKAVSSVTQGIGSVLCLGSSIVPFSALVSKIVQNTRYLNLSVTSELTEVYQTWNTDLISWDVPNIFSNSDHFESSSLLFSQYGLDSPFLVNFWPTLLNIVIGFGTFGVCVLFKKAFEHKNYKGWAYSLVLKLVAGSFNFALVQAYACMDDILFYLVLDVKTNPFNSFFSWTSMIFAVIFLVLGCLQVFFNVWTVYKYQGIKNKGAKEIKAFNEENQYWELFYSDFNDEDLWSQSFFAILIIRSTLSSLTITVFSDYPLLQTSYLVMMDMAILSFLYLKNPLNTFRGTLAQYYYETITLLVHFCAFIESLQDSFDKSSETVRLIMSSGIIYSNTALITGAIGFMFIEIYEILKSKNKAQKRKKLQSFPDDNQETQNLTRVALSEKRQDWEQTVSIDNLHLESESNQNRKVSNLNMESNLNIDNSREFDIHPSQRINLQRKQSQVPIRHQRLQRNNAKIRVTQEMMNNNLH